MRNLLSPSPPSSPRKFVLIRPDVKGPLPPPCLVCQKREKREIRSQDFNHFGRRIAPLDYCSQRSFLSNPWCKIQRLHTPVDERNRKGNEKKERETNKQEDKPQIPRYR